MSRTRKSKKSQSPTPTDTPRPPISESPLQRWLPWIAGLALLGLYLFHVLPPDPKRLGYVEDACYYDLSRGLLAEQMRNGTFPSFETDRFMAPQGAPIPFFSWSIERDWLGAWFWRLSRDFPFHWTLYATSLLLSFCGVGWIALRMGLSRISAAAFATLAVGFHVPRHFKTFHHFEHLITHWVFLSFFLDAWIWRRFTRDRVWSWSLELWRVVLGLAALLGTGYTWPILLLEGGLVRASLLAYWLATRHRPVRLEGSRRSAWFAGFTALALLITLGRWFGALVPVASRYPDLWQPMAWFGEFTAIFESLAWSRLFDGNPARFETVVSIGWTWLLPALLGLTLVLRQWGLRAGLLLVTPFAIFGALLIPYSFAWGNLSYHHLLQSIVPLLKFVRVGSRVALFFPQLFGVLILLCWPELRAWASERLKKSRTLTLALFGLFAVHAAVEISWLASPIQAMAPLDSRTTQLLEKIRELPGDLVLDLPFCAAGGNAVCTQDLCPHYPRSTVAHCFRAWHDKGVYGVYAGRMVQEFCAPYYRAPIVDWVKAWHQERCLSSFEWDELCRYLDRTPRHAAVLVYPHLWKSVNQPECRAEFEKRLGPPIGASEFQMGERFGTGTLLAFPGRCRTQSTAALSF